MLQAALSGMVCHWWSYHRTGRYVALYIYMCVCVCVCAWISKRKTPILGLDLNMESAWDILVTGLGCGHTMT